MGSVLSLSGRLTQAQWVEAAENRVECPVQKMGAGHLPHINWPWAHGETPSAAPPSLLQGPDGYPGDAGSLGEPGDQGAKVGAWPRWQRLEPSGATTFPVPAPCRSAQPWGTTAEGPAPVRGRGPIGVLPAWPPPAGL